MNMIKTIKSLPMAVAAAAVLAALPMPEGTPIFGEKAAFAQRADAGREQKTRKVQALSADFHKKLQKAQEAIDLKNYAEGMEILNDALERKANDYEKAVAWQLKAQVFYEQDDVQGTIRAYEEILRFADSIPEALEIGIIYNLGQLYYSEEDFDKSLEYIQRWQNRVDPTLISVSNLQFIANLHYVRNEFEECLNYIYQAIEVGKTVDTVEVKESWYSIALSSHWELGQYEKVRDVLEILLINWPKPRYWTQLAGIYQELGQEQTSYSLTEAAYKQGFLDDNETQLVNVAQIQLARGAPIKCAWILEKAFKENRVEQSPKNEKILGQCYMMAYEYEKALKPLSVAAKGDEDGDLWFQIAQVQMQLGHYKDAVGSFENVIKAFKGDKSDKAKDKILSATMQQGQAYTELKQFKEARQAFKTAKRMATDRKDKRMVTQWESYLAAEEAREEMLKG
ncbi:tetratricopeptide repeat protein [Kordiimonas lacus]|uniref:Tetratricopeptide repeat-containing protein n=1 Tax=Kordiimonas lacus TaxID=637679 RepID=A0A1G6XWD7_9PROT|nr:tetratricopeptide repeat protein [Kordiimonas lacus]SDD81725.1 Tetratricopeptide repeat-containing protein [Kordiimonas lacus]